MIAPEGKPENVDGENYYIRDGVVVVPKGAVFRTEHLTFREPLGLFSHPPNCSPALVDALGLVGWSARFQR